MSYESPITMYTDRIVKDIVEKQDGYLLEEVRRVGFDINKEELKKALAYDRDQYMRGYFDGKMDKPPVITNADRIRGMSDEELAELLDEGCRIHGKCPNEAWDGGTEPNTSCRDCWLEWLKSQVEVDGCG